MKVKETVDAIKSAKHIALICEGGAETAIMDIKKLYILRVIDSRREGFRLKVPYGCQVEVINIITAPEIEMLVIISEGKLKEYNKSGKKPSDFCIEELGHKNVKTRAFIEKYFEDPKKLVDSIREYHRVHRQNNGELFLFDLLTHEAQR